MAPSRRFCNFDPWPELQPPEGLGLAGAGDQKVGKLFFFILFIFSTDNAKGTSLPLEKSNGNDILTFFYTFFIVLRK